MAKNWMAYEAAKVIYGDNREEIAEVGSRYPLLTRMVSMLNNDYVLDLLSALPKVTARVIETGLKEMEVNTDTEAEEEVTAAKKAPVKKETKSPAKTKKAEPEEADDDDAGEDDYENMTAKDLYALCCKRGISSKCTDRKKTTLISVLEANDNNAGDDDADDWGEEEDETDPYEGKTAKELFKMCTDRKIKTKPKLTADAYAKLLKKADEAEDEDGEDEDEDDWEI